MKDRGGAGWRKTIPKMQVGKYAGTPVDQLPNQYLRWMMTQDFPRDVMDVARRKLKESAWNNDPIHLTRHAMDMFSLRFITYWESACIDAKLARTEEPGLASFITRLAQAAWDEGKDVSKHRHSRDGIVKQHNGIKWVFSVNYAYPEYKDVITVMPSEE